MARGGTVPGRWTAAADVSGVLAVVGGLVLALRVGWGERGSWPGLDAGAGPCRGSGGCLAGDAATTPVTGGGLASAVVLGSLGLALLVVVAVATSWGVRRPPLRVQPWGRTARTAGAVTLAVQALVAVPVLVGLLVGPTLSAALAWCGVVALVLVLALVGAQVLAARDAVVVAVAAAVLEVVSLVAVWMVADAGAVSLLLRVVLLVLVPPTVTGVATGLGVHGVVRLRRPRRSRPGPRPGRLPALTAPGGR
ncbi:hypothetical protein [Phycicoccus flavus]|uniref:hypothetical protein n=1 Tax=Phycicoccus flavus TaxID=2502783 RepID=UPI000FEC068F|nr:hypothetical protein [Phycicoccus flavus]NHA70144.1 hypothetical protein [Phycicoccus flavus]